MDCSIPASHPSPTLRVCSNMSTESVMPSKHLIFCCPLLLPLSIFLSIRVFSNESVLRIRWPKYWSFNFSISPSSEYSGLISFGRDWLDLLAYSEITKGIKEHESEQSNKQDFPSGTAAKSWPANVGVKGSIPAPGRFHVPQSD